MSVGLDSEVHVGGFGIVVSSEPTRERGGGWAGTRCDADASEWQSRGGDMGETGRCAQSVFFHRGGRA